MATEIRRLTVDGSGRASIGGHGIGLEVLDGGAYGRENLLVIGTGFALDTEPFADQVIRCVPGTRYRGEFDTLTLRSSVATALRDSVVVKILRADPGSWNDGDPSGKPRRRWLAQSSAAVATLAWQSLWESSTAVEVEPYFTTEEFSVCTTWAGIVTGDQSFDVYVFGNPNPKGAGTWRCVQKFNAKNYSAVPVGAPYNGGYVVDFMTGGPAQNHSTAGASSATPWPSGGVKVYANNPGGTTVNLEWLLGVRG